MAKRAAAERISDRQTLVTLTAEATDVPLLARELEQTIDAGETWVRRALLAKDTTWCQWAGQTDDGLKWASSSDDEPPFPWEGASDTRPRLVDEKVRETHRLCNAAFKRGRRKVAGLEMEDRPLAQLGNTALKWMTETQMRRHAPRERKLALYWRNTQGLSVMRVGWRKRHEYRMEAMDVFTLARQMGLGPALQLAAASEVQRGGSPEDPKALIGAFLARIQASGGNPQEVAAFEEISNALDLLRNESRHRELVDTLQALYPLVQRGKLHKAVKELRKTGETELPVPYLCENTAEWRALEVWEDVFFPTSTTALQEDAPWVAQRHWLTAAELEEKRLNEEWSDDFIEAVRKTEGDSSTDALSQRVQRDSDRYTHRNGGSWESGAEDRDGLFEVFEVWYWGVDAYGVRSLLRTVISLHLPQNQKDLYGVHEMVDDAGGELPYYEQVMFRDSRPLLECTGLGWLLYTYQMEVKTQRDFRIDAASISILPPVRRHYSDIGKPLDISPARPIYESVRGTTEFMRPPDSRTALAIELEETVKEDVCRLAGSAHEKIAPPQVQLHQQEHADEYLGEMVMILQATFRQMRLHLDAATWRRVAGEQAAALAGETDELENEFDLRIVFDARELDSEFAQMKAKNAIELAQLDTNAIFDRDKMVADLMALIDVNWAQDWKRPPQQAAEQEQKEAQTNLALIMQGIEPIQRRQGPGAGLQKKYLMAQVQGERANPAVVAQMTPNPGDDAETRAMKQWRAETFQNHLQYLDHQYNQATENPRAGIMGARPMVAQEA